MSAENRGEHRWHLMMYLRVYDCETKELVGHIIDISSGGGLGLICDEPLIIDKIYSLEMVIREQKSKKKAITFTAKCKRAQLDVNPDFFAVGLEFVEITPEAKRAIKNLVTTLGFKD